MSSYCFSDPDRCNKIYWPGSLLPKIVWFGSLLDLLARTKCTRPGSVAEHLPYPDPQHSHNCTNFVSRIMAVPSFNFPWISLNIEKLFRHRKHNIDNKITLWNLKFEERVFNHVTTYFNHIFMFCYIVTQNKQEGNKGISPKLKVTLLMRVKACRVYFDAQNFAAIFHL